MIISVTGSRTITDYSIVKYALDTCGFSITRIRYGKCERGVDALAFQYAQEHGIPADEFPAEWIVNNRLDRSAGHKRNNIMASGSDAIVAIWDGVSNGTFGTYKLGKKYNIPVRVYIYSESSILQFHVIRRKKE